MEGFDTIRDDEFTRELSQSSREVIYRRLTDDLIEQIQLCARNQQIYAHMEGANNAIRAKEFQNFGQRSSQDLERLKQSSQQASKKPIFHYEKRHMHFIQFNNELTDNDLEVSIAKALNRLTLINEDNMIVSQFYYHSCSSMSFEYKSFERTFVHFDILSFVFMHALLCLSLSLCR